MRSVRPSRSQNVIHRSFVEFGNFCWAFLNTYRTLRLAPTSEVRQVFDELAAFGRFRALALSALVISPPNLRRVGALPLWKPDTIDLDGIAAVSQSIEPRGRHFGGAEHAERGHRKPVTRYGVLFHNLVI